MDQLKDTQIKAEGGRRESFGSQNSQTANEFIQDQIRLEADAREAFPYRFDACTYDLGPLRQSLYACLTCNPLPENPDEEYKPAGVCYTCSMECHGEHTLVELFNKRNFVCDCGTTRMPATSPCTMREDPKTGRMGVHSQEAAKDNKYNHNFKNRFCGCAEEYDATQEKGIMFQCMGLGTVETGGCGEDWWHPECLIGLPRGWYKNLETDKRAEILGGGDAANDTADDEVADEVNDTTPLPPGFPTEGAFDHLLCFKCINSNPWLKQYAGTQGFLPPVYLDGGLKEPVQEPKQPAEEPKEQSDNSKKRKAEDDIEESTEEPTTKRVKEESPKDQSESSNLASIAEEPTTKVEEPTTKTEPETKPKVEPSDTELKPKHVFLPTTYPTETISLFLEEDFYDKLCHCAECYPKLAPYIQLREEEDTYEPPLSEDGDGAPGSTGTGSILERGEAALSNVDRVRAIEGAMIYNRLRDKVKDFLRPFAESGTAVSAEDVKGYFERLRGDEGGIKDAANRAEAEGGDSEGDSRREQNGY